MKTSYKFFIVTMVILYSHQALAQQFLERVYLKDSITVHEGIIVEQAPSKYIRILRSKYNDTLTIPLDQIWKLTKFYPADTTTTKQLQPLKIEEKPYHKAAFVELLGTAGIYSINFDMRTERGRRDGWGFRAGYEYLSVSASDSANTEKVKIAFRALPFQLNYLLGKRKGFLELGVGATFISPKVSGSGSVGLDQELIDGFNLAFSSVIGSFTVGYRHLPLKKGLMYKLAFTPLLVKGLLIPFAGIGIGYNFN